MINTAINLYEILIWSAFGGAAKTHHEYKKKKCTLKKLVFMTIVNLFYCVGFGYVLVGVFLAYHPTEGALAKGVALVAGSIGMNVVAAVNNVEWSRIIEGVIEKWS